MPKTSKWKQKHALNNYSNSERGDSTKILFRLNILFGLIFYFSFIFFYFLFEIQNMNINSRRDLVVAGILQKNNEQFADSIAFLFETTAMTDWLNHPSIQRIVLWLLGWLEPASQPTTTHVVRGGSYAVVVLWRWLLAWIESTLRLGACLAITTRPDAFLRSPRPQQHGIIMPLATINNLIHLSQQHHH